MAAERSGGSPVKNNTQNVSRRSAASRAVIRKLDAAVDDFVRRTRFFHVAKK
jgi:phytoene/squalene synthetase